MKKKGLFWGDSLILPGKREVGYGIQGLGVGFVIGGIVAPLEPFTLVFPVVFFCCVTLGGYLIRFSPAPKS
jgi:hypothetical protein